MGVTPFLPFTYDAPGPLAVDLYEPREGDRDAQIWKPIAYWWRPRIFCGTEIEKHGRALQEKKIDIPWHVPIEEIRVESRRAYEILCKLSERKFHERERTQFFVRINPPLLPPCDYRPVPELRQTDIGCFLGEKEAIKISGDIAAAFDSGIVIVGPEWLEYASMVRVAIFPLLASGTAEPLACAIAAGCAVVSSDAGAAEEYLSEHARPGTWHVIHSWNRRHFVEAAKDLLGRQNDMMQTDYVDDLPMRIDASGEKLPKCSNQ